jgi:hypothetical protein
LKRPRQWVRKINQNSVVIPLQVSTLDDQRTFHLQGLLDSGATGCYIDEGFVRAKGINLESLPRPIPVYNADGSHNDGGPIRTVAKMRLAIADHVEVLSFAVTNIGKMDIIVGYDWLRQHNPLIDWRSGQISFSRCPPTCCSEFEKEPEDEPKMKKFEQIGLQEGDRIFVTKMEPETTDDMYWREVRERMEAQPPTSRRSVEEAI